MNLLVYGPLLQLLATIVFVWFTWRLLKQDRRKPSLRSVAILVLGDIGRSPRMMYHAESFAKLEFETFFIGYRGSKPVASLLSLPLVRFVYLSEPPSSLSKLPFILLAPIKILHQIATILEALFFRVPHPPEFILVQNPPSIPTLALVWLAGRLRGSKVIIDWHNLGYSILALKLGNDHPFVKIAKRFEAWFGQTAYAHLFVTQAMRDHLVREWKLIGHKAVLHDRPPAHFRRASPPETHELFQRLRPSLSTLTRFFPPSSPPYSTPFTHVTTTTPSPTVTPSPSNSDLSMPSLRPERPALLISSTSWTPDEDFSILIEALGMYDKRAKEIDRELLEGKGDGKPLPKVLMVVTGKGPLREKYMKEIQRLQIGRDDSGDDGWKWVRCVSLWLEAEDYPVLLGSADLGISLHSSSSALDLPMKIVDMFGCGLPVCALDFACLHELVKDGTNGLVFKNAEQLAAQIEGLLASFPKSPSLSALHSSLLKSSKPPEGAATQHLRHHGGLIGEEGDHWEWNTWDENWGRVVKPLILRDAMR
ncbi:glycosyltransferase family 33 protein [Jaapia argillacea MUCL 33604]|uniref:Chitobiosyldiphosphodolichol beta-mannosyltransferase n=1 Tax=Jaapia argillacea MUCL 33604 TaxID=933084 RepID=A0A067PUK1_9AGAM|nr:glycosyltransferase family 33 protein [Jaapia argillacea MUCL 33604]